MVLGGNERLTEFLEEYGLAAAGKDRYMTKAAQYYRTMLKELADGKTFDKDKPSLDEGRELYHELYNSQADLGSYQADSSPCPGEEFVGQDSAVGFISLAVTIASRASVSDRLARDHAKTDIDLPPAPEPANYAGFSPVEEVKEASFSEAEAQDRSLTTMTFKSASLTASEPCNSQSQHLNSPQLPFYDPSLAPPQLYQVESLLSDEMEVSSDSLSGEAM